MDHYVELLENVFSNPWLVLFAGLWVLGWLLKEHSPIKNAIIAWILGFVGAILGLIIIEVSIAGGIVGLLASYVIIGAYEQYKGAKEIIHDKNGYIMERKE